jgi:hypothetical protein
MGIFLAGSGSSVPQNQLTCPLVPLAVFAHRRLLCPTFGCYRGYAAPVEVFARSGMLDLADDATIMSDVPPIIMLIPTSRPIAQAAVPRKPAMTGAATTRSDTPLDSSHPH